METWIYIYYVIVIIIFVLIVIRIVLAKNNDAVLSKSLISPLNLETGDLLFVRYDNPLGYFMRFWSNSPWTHIAMVYRKNEQVYVMETANYAKNRGVLFLPIGKWRRLNRKCKISVMKLTTPKGYDRERIFTVFESLMNKQLDTFSISWIRLLSTQKYKSLQNQENITCYEMIVHLLQESDIAKKQLSAASYFPTDIINGRLPLNEGFEFSKLSHLI